MSGFNVMSQINRIKEVLNKKEDQNYWYSIVKIIKMVNLSWIKLISTKTRN
jgi:hypothetical protein